jgi:hypothetical protein
MTGHKDSFDVKLEHRLDLDFSGAMPRLRL